eukprot:scaffold1708_cov117-Isochrysis_galbana.AAC.1
MRQRVPWAPELVVGHSLGGNAAIRTVDRGLAERSVTLNPFIRPSSIGPGQHAVYRHGDDPAMLSFEAITRNQRATDLALGQAGTNTEIHIIPRTDLRSSVDPVHAHSVDRFIDQPLPSERAPLLSRPTKTVASSALADTRAGRVATSLGGAGLGIGVGVLTGAAVGGLGVTDPYANSGISGAFGNLAQEAIAGVATAAEAGVALAGGAAGGAGFVGGYELAKQLGANDVVATGAGIVTGSVSQAAVAQSIGLATSALEPAAAAAVGGVELAELGVLGAEVEVVGEALLALAQARSVAWVVVVPTLHLAGYFVVARPWLV